MTFNFLGPGLTVNVEAKVKEQIILDSSVCERKNHLFQPRQAQVKWIIIPKRELQMSQTISLKLSDFDAALLSELSKREAKTPEELILEALHSLFASRLDDKIIPLSSDVFDACSKIIFEPEKDKEVLMRRHKLMDTKPVWDN